MEEDCLYSLMLQRLQPTDVKVNGFKTSSEDPTRCSGDDVSLPVHFAQACKDMTRDEQCHFPVRTASFDC